MCLPFNCGGGDKGDEYGPHDPISSAHQQPFHPPPQQAPPPPSGVPRPGVEENDQSYKPSPTQQAYGDHYHGTNMPAAAGGEGRGARAPPPQGYVADVNKNGGGGRVTAPFGYSGDDDVPASVVGGVVRGREAQSAPGRIAVASTTPATQGFNTNKHWDLPAAQQAPPQRTHHGHGHGSSAASHPSEAADDNMRAPLQVRPMARRGPQGY